MVWVPVRRLRLRSGSLGWAGRGNVRHCPDDELRELPQARRRGGSDTLGDGRGERALAATGRPLSKVSPQDWARAVGQREAAARFIRSHQSRSAGRQLGTVPSLRNGDALRWANRHLGLKFRLAVFASERCPGGVRGCREVGLRRTTGPLGHKRPCDQSVIPNAARPRQLVRGFHVS
jgi:hypothetical protein